MRQRGFTLVELAIVLVIIGLILGMAFKGKDLIDGAKVKNLAAQHNKVIAGINIFYEKYGSYPGDGCAAGQPLAGTAICPGARNGLIENGNEATAFWVALIDRTNILTSAERRSMFGQDWNIWNSTGAGNPSFVGAGRPVAGSWLDLPGGAQADPRLVCALDRQIDDGASGSGVIRDADSITIYTPATDCWSLTGQVNVVMRVLP
ncbi:type II secretion system protein [Deefgea rivuli]|uniref:type II secretion system protein n=1 Tax=Deefgea rivuli TaxID=400948 RepID=UPI0006856115|nr:prepilin-type N-terminal cleavage/methylation domain-containing protein [Deefgea rivuli]